MIKLLLFAGGCFTPPTKKPKLNNHYSFLNLKRRVPTLHYNVSQLNSCLAYQLRVYTIFFILFY